MGAVCGRAGGRAGVGLVGPGRGVVVLVGLLVGQLELCMGLFGACGRAPSRAQAAGLLAAGGQCSGQPCAGCVWVKGMQGMRGAG